MRGNIADKVTLKGLATACAMPERTLVKQFQKFIGLSPIAYLLRLRLNAAREELLNGDGAAAVADIASRFGFTHLGRFATVYRSSFGETPSATRELVRARMAHGASAHSDNDGNRSESRIGMAREKPSLIVLPLSTETLKENLEARDLTEQLAAALSRMRVAGVTLAHPSRRFATNAPQPRNAGTQYCLTGRLMQHGERTRVIVRLIDVAADQHLWGDSFDGSLDDPFTLRDHVVDCVLSNVVATITDAEIGRACDKDPNVATARDRHAGATAHHGYDRARHAQGDRDSDACHRIRSDQRTRGRVARRLSRSPGIPIWHDIAGTRARPGDPTLGARRSSRSRRRLLTAARAATALLRQDEADALAARAVAQDPTNGWAWERHGMARLFGGGDPKQAIADFNRALRLRGPSMSRLNGLPGIAGADCASDQMTVACRLRRTALAEKPAATLL